MKHRLRWRHLHISPRMRYQIIHNVQKFLGFTSHHSLTLPLPDLCSSLLDSFAKDIITVAVETHKSQHGPSHPVGGASCFVSSLSSQEGGHNCFPKGTDGRSPTLRVGEGASGNLQEPWKMLDTCTCSKQPTSDLMSCFSNTWESQFQVSSLSC